MLYMKYKKIWFRQQLRNPEVLRNNPNANCIHKNHKLADAQTAAFSVSTQKPVHQESLRSFSGETDTDDNYGHS